VLLTEQGVRRTTISKRRKREALSLHSRILEYRAKRPDVAELLLAVKWLGNAGSHPGTGTVSQEDLLDGFEMLEQVLDEVYRRTRARLATVRKASTGTTYLGFVAGVARRLDRLRRAPRRRDPRICAETMPLAR
jgi:hypothetical protein